MAFEKEAITMLHGRSYESTTRLKSYEKTLTSEGPFCANCQHARQVVRRRWVGNRPVGEPIVKVYCAKGRWAVGQNGKGRYKEIYTIWSIVSPGCPDYLPMGDRDDLQDLTEFLSSLPKCKEDMAYA